MGQSVAKIDAKQQSFYSATICGNCSFYYLVNDGHNCNSCIAIGNVSFTPARYMESIMRLNNEDNLKLDKDEHYEREIGESKQKLVDGIALVEPTRLSLDRFSPEFTLEKPKMSGSSDQVFTIGKEANVTADEIKAEKAKARMMDKVEIQKLLDQTFCQNPPKTIDEMSDEEVIKHGYTLEATIRKLRIHLFEISNEKSARRNKSNTKMFDSLDANYKPKPIALANQANDVRETLAQKLLDDDDSPFTTIEEAREFVKKGAKQ